MSDDAFTRQAIDRLFAAIERRDLLGIEAALHPDVTWQNVPHAPSVGRDAVLQMLGPILRWSDAVRWDVVSSHCTRCTAAIERVDRFVIAGAEHAVECHGVFGVDDEGLVTFVRDYADIGDWRQRIGPVYRDMATRPAVEVVARHIEAVERRDPVAMAADYALDAVLIRDGRQHSGYREIDRYFAEVPARLGSRTLMLSAPSPLGEHEVEVGWTIEGTTSGIDRYEVSDGWIRRQVVSLTGPDF